MIRALIAFATASTALAQAPPAFEVASIRPHEGLVRQVGRDTTGPLVNIMAYTVSDLIMDAYSLQKYQLIGANGWMVTDAGRYDISARVAGDEAPSRDAVRPMLQTLLTERFQFKFHHETREMSVYALVVAKGGAKLTANTSGSEMGGVGMRSKGTATEMRFTNSAVGFLAQQLTSVPGVDRPVLDKTGLMGKFDFNLQTVMDPATRIVTGSAGESIFTLLEDQLGLKLESQKAPVEVLVIDSVERPSEN